MRRGLPSEGEGKKERRRGGDRDEEGCTKEESSEDYQSPEGCFGRHWRSAVCERVCVCSLNHFLLFSSAPVFTGTAPTPFNIQTTCQCSLSSFTSSFYFLWTLLHLLAIPPFFGPLSSYPYFHFSSSSSLPHCFPLLTCLLLLFQLVTFVHPSHTHPSLIAISVSPCSHPPLLVFLFSTKSLLPKYHEWWETERMGRKQMSHLRGEAEVK